MRLEFCFGPHADSQGEGHIERMWVEVLEQNSDGDSRGRLRNTPARLRALEIGDLVAFRPEHIASIDCTDDQMGYPQDEWLVVDRAVLRDDTPPDIVVRAPGPYMADQLQWWLICRDDTGGPTAETAGTLTDHFPGLEEPLKAGEGFWELVHDAHAIPAWIRIAEQDIQDRQDRRDFLSWLERTAVHMRSSGGKPGGSP